MPASRGYIHHLPLRFPGCLGDVEGESMPRFWPYSRSMNRVLRFLQCIEVTAVVDSCHFVFFGGGLLPAKQRPEVQPSEFTIFVRALFRINMSLDLFRVICGRLPDVQ